MEFLRGSTRTSDVFPISNFINVWCDIAQIFSSVQIFQPKFFLAINLSFLLIYVLCIPFISIITITFLWTFFCFHWWIFRNFIRIKMLMANFLFRPAKHLSYDHLRSYNKYWSQSAQLFWRLLDSKPKIYMIVQEILYVCTSVQGSMFPCNCTPETL